MFTDYYEKVVAMENEQEEASAEEAWIENSFDTKNWRDVDFMPFVFLNLFRQNFLNFDFFFF